MATMLDVRTIVGEIVDANPSVSPYWVHMKLQATAARHGYDWSRELDFGVVRVLVGFLFAAHPKLNPINV